MYRKAQREAKKSKLKKQTGKALGAAVVYRNLYHQAVGVAKKWRGLAIGCAVGWAITLSLLIYKLLA